MRTGRLQPGPLAHTHYDGATGLAASTRRHRRRPGLDPQRPTRQGTRRRALHAGELFRTRWASQDVRVRCSGRKRLQHPIVGRLDDDSLTTRSPRRAVRPP
ncbi:MmyB family transcriptional regulator [Rhodococcoides yunnanense]|uniref:MmyB family transcriptional regulator n=1 Tax=Rhodococcoides yunnanense TaxID=278209 RepID=UPI001474DEC0